MPNIHIIGLKHKMQANSLQDPRWQELDIKLKNSSSKERLETLHVIKDAVIGSNKQKEALIVNGLAPTILDISTCSKETKLNKLDALVILGSLARGSADHVRTLVERYNIIPLLIKEITLETNDKKCIEVCLCTLQSIYDHPFAPFDPFFEDVESLTFFLGLAHPASSFKTQVAVTSILVSLCRCHEDQLRLLQAGTIHTLSRMICLDNSLVKLSALKCLACMCYSNRDVSDNVCVTSFQGKSLPDILTSLLSRLVTPDIQLTAAKTLTYIYRSGTLLSTDSRICNNTLPALARLCSDSFQETVRASAAGTLAYLIQIDSELQRIASISNNLLKSLSQLLLIRTPDIKSKALTCFSSLGANDEAIRKRIMETFTLVDAIFDGLSSEHKQIQLASLRCLHSLSRSVQQLRTTFQDYTAWKPLLEMLTTTRSIEILYLVTSIICNLVLEFSPGKDALLSSGIVEKMCPFVKHSDAALRLNGVWTFMNLAFQSCPKLKSEIVDALGITTILELFQDADTAIVMKALGLCRNLFSKPEIVDDIMGRDSEQVVKALNEVLSSDQTPEVKEQALCVTGYIIKNAGHGFYIGNDDTMMRHLGDYMFNSDSKLQAAALFVLYNLIYRPDTWMTVMPRRLEQFNFISKIRDLNRKVGRNKSHYEEYISDTTKRIVLLCKEVYPEVMNS